MLEIMAGFWVNKGKLKAIEQVLRSGVIGERLEVMEKWLSSVLCPLTRFWSPPPETWHLQRHAYSLREVNRALWKIACSQSSPSYLTLYRETQQQPEICLWRRWASGLTPEIVYYAKQSAPHPPPPPLARSTSWLLFCFLKSRMNKLLSVCVCVSVSEPVRLLWLLTQAWMRTCRRMSEPKADASL